MKLYQRILFTLAIAALSLTAQAQSEAENDLSKAFELIRTQMVNGKNINLESKSLEGLIQQLSPNVQLIDAATPTPAIESTTNSVTVPEQKFAATLFDKHYVSFRLGTLNSETVNVLLTNWNTLSESNTIKGIVLDLRGAKGEDYQVAAEVASLFLNDMNGGDSSTPKILFTAPGKKYLAAKTDLSDDSELKKLPLSILINHETTAAAEALAGTLHSNPNRGTVSGHFPGILIGNCTAGATVTWKDFPLPDGTKSIRLVTDSVSFPDDTYIDATGLKPDISVTVTAKDELAYMADPFTNLRVLAPISDDTTNTNKVNIRLNEAELVKMQREASRADAEGGSDSKVADEEPQVPIYDPVLSRGLDILKSVEFFKF